MPARRRLRLLVPVAVLLALAATASGQWVEDSIDVGGLTIGDLVYNSREDVVYGVASQSDRFFAIACSSNQLVESYGIPEPCDVVYDSTDNKAYCTYRQGYLAVIDGETHQWVRTIVLDWATCAVWDAVSDRLYVSCYDENAVAVIHCVTDSVVDRIGVGRDPDLLYLGSQQRRLYVLNHDSESISIVDLDSHEVVETIRLSFVPGGGCYSAAVDKFYCGAGSDVVVIDGAGDSVLSVIELPMVVHSAVAVESESLVMFGTGSPTAVDTIYVLDAVADTLVAAHAVGGTAWALFWSPTSGMVYAAVSGASGLVVVAEDGSRILASLAVGEFPFCLAYSPGWNRLYVGHLNGRHVYVIRDSVTGIAEPEAREQVPAPRQSVLAVGSFLLPGAERLSLVDVCGRGVGVLEPGPNDLADLAPGVYLGLSPSGEVRLRLVKAR